MDSPFSKLGLLIFAISISFYAFVVQSQIQDENGAESSSSLASIPPPPPPPPPPLPPPSSPPPLGVGPPPHPRSPSRHRTQNKKPYTQRSPATPHHRRRNHLPPPPPPPHRMNAGKKVGLLFVGIAAIMQIGMVGFLVIKRRQLLKNNDRYETCT